MLEAASVDGWATVSELARIRGVQKSAISKRVTRLEALGLLHTRPGARGTKLVSLAEFERAIADTTDAVRETNGRAARLLAAPGDPVLAREQARKTKAAADIAELDRDQRLGLLVRVDEISAGAAMHGESLGRLIDQIADRADDLATVVAKDGATGLRGALRGLARELRGHLADALAALAQEAAPAPAEAPAEGADELEAVA